MAREPERADEDGNRFPIGRKHPSLRLATWPVPDGKTLLNLPLQPGALLGRESEMRTLCAHLVDDELRLITLTGFGGVGKSRLAIEAAGAVRDSFEDGVWLVDLSHLTEPDEVATAIAEVLDIQGASSQSGLDGLRQYLQSRHMLLLLDNFEHVMAAAGPVDHLVGTCPQLTVLVTSREPLRSSWEHVMRITPLAVPELKRLPPVNELRQVPSVALFVQRARAIQLNFELTEENARDVARICAHLEGLPLAIQLAAARTNVLTPAAILRRLDPHLSLLRETGREVPARQRSITATIEWSYALLTAPEQTLFRRLSVFAGGFGLDAAVAVTAPDNPNAYVLEGITQLVNKSLILTAPTDEGEPRFAVNEMLRQYCFHELVASGEQDLVQARHAAFFVQLGERGAEELDGPQRDLWLIRLGREHDNVTAALRWARETGQGDLEIRLACALAQFAWVRGLLREGTHLLEDALTRWPDEDPYLRTRALDVLAALLRWAGQFDRARPIRDEAVRLARTLEDPLLIARTTMNLGALLTATGELERAQRTLEEALVMWEELDHPRGVAQTLLYLGTAATLAGQHESARIYANKSLAISSHLGTDRTTALNLGILARIAQLEGNMPEATQHLLEALGLCGQMGDQRLITFCIEGAACLAAAVGDPASVARLLGASDELRDLTGYARADMEARMYTETLERLHERMEEHALVKERAQGRSLPLDRIVYTAVAAIEEIAEGRGQKKTLQPSGNAELLSKREQEVLQLLAQGLSNKQIARQLLISENTAKFHVGSLFNKLGADNRAQVVALAAQRNLLQT